MTDFPGWWVTIFRTAGALFLIAAAFAKQDQRDWCLVLAYLCLLLSWWRLYDLWCKAREADDGV